MEREGWEMSGRESYRKKERVTLELASLEAYSSTEIVRNCAERAKATQCRQLHTILYAYPLEVLGMLPNMPSAQCAQFFVLSLGEPCLREGNRD